MYKSIVKIHVNIMIADTINNIVCYRFKRAIKFIRWYHDNKPRNVAVSMRCDRVTIDGSY